jgi:Transposase DDE domain
MMIKRDIGNKELKLEEIRKRFEEGQLNAIRDVLPNKVITQACIDHGMDYRERLLTPVVTVFHYLTAALWPEQSFQSSATVNGINVSSSSMSKARNRLPLEVMYKLFEYVCKLCEQEAESAARHKGLRVVLLDGTGLSMEDNSELLEEFGTSNSKHGKGKYPTAKLVTACLAFTRTILSYKLSNYRTAEVEMAKTLLPYLQSGDLIIGDCHYAGANHYCKYLEHGLEFLTPVQQRLKVERLKKVRVIGPGDFIAQVPVGKQHRQKDPDLPEILTLRFVKVNLKSRRGNNISYLVTSLTNDKQFSSEDIKEMYRLRWPVETLFYELKLPLSADVLRSKKTEGIYKEVAAKMMAANLVRCIQIQAAKKHNLNSDRISFINTVRIIISISLKMSTAPKYQLNELYNQMLDSVASNIVPHRPGRREPRRIRREKTHYQYLSNSFTRADWREKHAVSA